MSSIPAYCKPPTLISAINAWLSRTMTKATLIDITTTLFSGKCSYFKLGVNNWASKTLIYPPSNQFIENVSSSPTPLRFTKSEILRTSQVLVSSLFWINWGHQPLTRPITVSLTAVSGTLPPAFPSILLNISWCSEKSFPTFTSSEMERTRLSRSQQLSSEI